MLQHGEMQIRRRLGWHGGVLASLLVGGRHIGLLLSSELELQVTARPASLVAWPKGSNFMSGPTPIPIAFLPPGSSGPFCFWGDRGQRGQSV